MSKISSPSEFVDKYFSRCGISGVFKPDQFWRLLHKKYGADAKRFDDCIVARENGGSVNPYPLKNKYLELSNAIAAQYDADFIKAFSVWIITERLAEEGTILEIGCENGLLLCLLATMYPDAQFVGLDICEEAILVATQRAQKLGLLNVRFYVSSIEKASEVIDESDFDLIISSKVFHEILFSSITLTNTSKISYENEVGNAYSINEVDAAINKKKYNVIEVETLRSLLSDDGIFISVDRWSRPEMTLFWVRLLESNQFALSLNHSNLLRVKCSMDPALGAETFVITVFRVGVDEPKSACDIVAFQGYQGFGEAIGGRDFIGPVAEMTYGALNTECIYEQKNVYYNGSGTQCTYVGFAGGLAYIYVTASTGFRKLNLCPRFMLPEVLPTVWKERADSEAYTEMSYRWTNKGLLSCLEIDLDAIPD